MPSTSPSLLDRLRAAVATGGRAVWARRGWVYDRRAQLAVLVGLLLVVVGTAAFVGVYDAVQDRDDLAELDEPVLDALVAARSPAVTAFLTAVSTVTGTRVLPVVVVVAALVWGVWRKAWWEAFLLSAGMIASTIVSVSLKAVIARPRPPLDTMTVPGAESSYSFPSGHTIGTATFLLLVAYLAWVQRPTLRRLLPWLVVVVLGVLAVALSRLYLGYHFVTDVVASMALAVAILGGVVTFDRRRAARAAQEAAD